MLRIINSGCNGYMGRAVTEMASSDDDITIVAGVDLNTTVSATFPVYANTAGLCDIDADVIIDFSSPKALEGILEHAISTSTPIVLCTTGYSAEQIDEIEKASKRLAVFRSGNMSVGINLLIDLIERACSVLGESFDVEIVEQHHKRKVDAPSGTALMLADAASKALPYKAKYVFEREKTRKPRDAREIGISSVRGGTIVGVHDVIFAGLDEVIELKHTAGSRNVFAAGALRAAKYLAGKQPGLYDMKNVLADG